MTADNAGVSGSAGACEPAVDTLYYDGRCSLCAAEIDRLAVERGTALRLVDIHALPPETSASTGDAGTPGLPSRDALLRTLHLRRADGSWVRAADANVAAWEGTPQERRLRVLRWPLIRTVVDLAYALWARWRYRRLYGRQFRETDDAAQQR